MLVHLVAGEGGTISHNIFISNCEQQTFICQEKDFPEFNKQITLVLSKESKHYLFLYKARFLHTHIHTCIFLNLSTDFMCTNDKTFGDGVLNEKAKGPCEENKVGEKTAVCRANGTWEIIQDNCVLQPIHELLQQSEVTLIFRYMKAEDGTEL